MSFTTSVLSASRMRNSYDNLLIGYLADRELVRWLQDDLYTMHPRPRKSIKPCFHSILYRHRASRPVFLHHNPSHTTWQSTLSNAKPHPNSPSIHVPDHRPQDTSRISSPPQQAILPPSPAEPCGYDLPVRHPQNASYQACIRCIKEWMTGHPFPSLFV